jgi:hypothetical protein
MNDRIAAAVRRLTPPRAISSRTILATFLLASLMTPFAGGDTGDVLREGVRNGTTSRETEVIGNIAESNARKGGFVTRQSNLSSTGGAAIYGCRSRSGGEPCLRASNLSTGHALQVATDGTNAARFEVAGGRGVSPSAVPFTTNGAGRVENLNADKVDGLHSSELIAAAHRAYAVGVRTANTRVDAAGEMNGATARADCPPGTAAISGGGTVAPDGGGTAPIALMSSQPSTDQTATTLGTGWQVTASEMSAHSEGWTLTAYAVCVARS